MENMAAPSNLLSEVNSLPWFHSIQLGEGVITPGVKSADVLRCEADVAFKRLEPGMTVIDIGAWDGFFSFEAKKRGASRVLATDHFSWVGGGWGTKRSFDLAKKVLELEIDERVIDPLEICSDTVEPFDCILFLGVLYHLKHPLYVLERISQIATHHLVMETQLDFTDISRPAVAFYPGAELANDSTNWWGPNVPAAIGMLKTAGFTRVEFSDHPAYPGVRGFFHAFR
jgi:tRNA (mo5U34)-methyltransferase